MRNKNYFLLFIGMLFASVTFAQVTVKGTVTDKEDNSPLPGVTVVIQNTTKGTVTDINGKYELQIDSLGQTLEFKFVGMQTMSMVATSSTVNAGMSAGVELDAMVVTALGISREKKALGYATQQVSGDEVNNVKYDNVVNSLSGRVAGAQVKQSGNFGGSTNIVLRGTTSLLGDNQALFVVDGVPINNSSSTTDYQKSGGKGYDYGNAVSDINPEDIESVNILKGAAATALYGERAANGVIIITTKTAAKGKKGVGVSFNSNYTFGQVDKTTFPKYQTNYGAGYGPYYSGGDKPGLEEYDFNGDGIDDYVVPFTEDASMGQRFDENLLVYQWDAIDPASPNYMKPTPWKSAGDDGAISFFETPTSFTNSLSIGGASDNASIRVSYRNLTQNGLMPNSKLVRNNIGVNTSYKPTDKLTITLGANYISTNTTGRNSTGYSDNIMSQYRQWWQTNVNLQDQKSIYESTGRNISWNPGGSMGPDGQTQAPIYWDNPYWSRYENYQNDTRNRMFGNLSMNYKITDKLSAMLRFTVDNYSELIEERRAVGSTSTTFGGLNNQPSGYSRINKSFNENNVDFILTYNTDLTTDLNLNVMGGSGIRRSQTDYVRGSTNGGLNVPGVFALSNASSVITTERASELGVNSIYGGFTLGYKRFLFLDVTGRNDVSSTLAEGNRSYFYPAVSGSFVFTELLDIENVSFGKFRLNYAQVGKAAPVQSLNNVYDILPAFTSPMNSSTSTQNNALLRPEITTSVEAGLEMYFWNKRLGFDAALYSANSVDQIFAVPVSYATGYTAKYMNAGEIQNRGIELTIFGRILDKKDFKWDATLNWAKNTNTVVSLTDGIENLQLASFQGGVSVNAKVGETYGAITGTDYVYTNGEKTIGTDGYYMRSATNDNVLGNITPDWTGGITNTFTYKSWSASFLIDWQKGGDVFSLDQWYGMGTGLYAETDYTNDLGNPVRNPVSEGGGVILEGVKEDGSSNDIRVEGGNYKVNGWSRNPNAGFIYDASYVKLREVAIHYRIPASALSKLFIENATLSFVGSNLWIIHKNLPHADPEAGLSSGNVQGFQSGVLPTTRTFGFNLKLNF